MKAVTRKARATERGNLIRTGGGPHAPPISPQQGAIISMVEEVGIISCEFLGDHCKLSHFNPYSLLIHNFYSSGCTCGDNGNKKLI